MSAHKEFISNLSLLKVNQQVKYQKKLYFMQLTWLNTAIWLGMAFIFWLSNEPIVATSFGVAALLNFIMGHKTIQKSLRLSLNPIFLSLNLGVLLWLIPFTGGLTSPLALWVSIVILEGLFLLRMPRLAPWLFVSLLAITLSHITLIYASNQITALFSPALSLLYIYNPLLLTIGLGGLCVFAFLSNTESDVKSNEAIETVVEENQQLKKQIRQINSRNIRLVKMYENLNRLGETNEQKTEIMTEIAKVLDQKHKTILTLNEKFEHQSKLLGEINDNITNSIRYAQKIQEAIIPEADWVVKHFRDAFIYFQPKDIVSGDFYWFEEKQLLDRKVKILIAADCTGHGVPGAFMTVMGNSLINEIIHEAKTASPDWILQELDHKVRETLSNKRGETQIHDGMDMVCLVIDDAAQEVHYAAAHNPLYYISNNELHQVKGSRYSVGSSQYRQKKEFEKHTIKTKPGDVFYVFTDGFQDQFGEKEQRKYMTRRYRNFLQSIHRMPLDKQLKIVESEFESWKGGIPQTDDVLLIGFRI